MRASPKDTMKKKDSAESSARVTPLEADTPDVEIVSPEPEEDDDPPLDPVQTPVVEHLVHVLLLPIKMVEQAEQDVTVPPLEYPEEQALQLFPLT